MTSRNRRRASAGRAGLVAFCCLSATWVAGPTHDLVDVRDVPGTAPSPQAASSTQPPSDAVSGDSRKRDAHGLGASADLLRRGLVSH